LQHLRDAGLRAGNGVLTVDSSAEMPTESVAHSETLPARIAAARPIDSITRTVEPPRLRSGPRQSACCTHSVRLSNPRKRQRETPCCPRRSTSTGIFCWRRSTRLFLALNGKCSLTNSFQTQAALSSSLNAPRYISLPSSP
jgi:hypothetical protein